MSQDTLPKSLLGYPLPLSAQAQHELVRSSLFGSETLPTCKKHESVMLYASDLSIFNIPCVCAIGAFDGLHKGHRALIAGARTDAQKCNLPCITVMFDPDPSEVLDPQRPEPRLLSVTDRIRGLLDLGVDGVVLVSFTAELAAQTPAAFVDHLHQQLQPVALHVGANFSFGQYGKGTVGTLRELEAPKNVSVVVQPLLQEQGHTVSATTIRTLLAQGDLSSAEGLLSRCHFIRGHVEHGRSEGRSMGFPTANVVCEPLSALPKAGVIGGYVVSDEGCWASAINVGAPVSFTDKAMPLFLEANLLNFSGDLYGKEVAVLFCVWLRAERKFQDIRELKRTVQGNISWVQNNLVCS